MKPIIVLPPDTISPEDISILKENGLCVVVSKDPSSIRLLDPNPSATGRTAMDQAAVSLCRKILSKTFWNTESTRQLIAATYVDLLIKGSPLDPEPQPQEIEKKEYDLARLDEVRKIARLDARQARDNSSEPAKGPGIIPVPAGGASKGRACRA